MAILAGRAARAGRPYQWAAYRDFSGGLSTHDIYHAIQPNQVSDVLNLYLDRRTNVWRKRNGYARVNSSALSAGGIRGIWRHYGSTKYLLVANGADIYRDDGSLGATFTSIQGSLANDVDVFFAAMEISGTLNSFACNGNNQNVKKWSGSGAMSDLGGSPPKARAILVHKNFVWLAHATTAQRVVYSDTADPETYPANNFFNLKTPGAGLVMGFAIHQDALIVFKEDSIWRIVGSSNDDFRLEIITASRGCASQRSIVATDDEVFFLGTDRMLYRLQGNTIDPIGLDIKPTLDDIPAAALATTAAAYYNGYYLFLFRRSAGTTNDRVLVYDAFRSPRVWAGLYDWPLNCAIVFGGTGDTGQLYAGQSSNGFALQLDTTSKDHTTTIPIRIQPRYDDQQVPHILKQYGGLLVGVLPFNGTLTADLLLDYATTSTSLPNQSVTTDTAQWGTAIWGTDKWGGSSYSQYAYRVPTPNKGFYAAPKLQVTDSDDDFYFYGFALAYRVQQPRFVSA